MSLTIPMLGLPVTLTSTLTLQAEYTSAGVQSAPLAAGTYWLLGDGSAQDLLQLLETALDGALGAVSVSVSLSGSTLKPIITATGSDTLESLTWPSTAEFSPQDIGFALDASVTKINPATGPPNLAAATYRPGLVWCPSEEDHEGEPTYIDAAVVQAGDDGLGVVDVYAGRKVWDHRFFEVYAPLIRSHYATSNLAGDVRSPTIVSGDTNAALDGWLRRYHRRCGGATPELKYTPDISDLSTHRSVVITSTEQTASVRGWIANDNPGPRYHELRFSLTELQ